MSIDRSPGRPRSPVVTKQSQAKTDTSSSLITILPGEIEDEVMLGRGNFATALKYKYIGEDQRVKDMLCRKIGDSYYLVIKKPNTVSANTENVSTQTLHAEENIMRDFNEMVKAFKAEFPDKKIATIDIILSHSPCVGETPSAAHDHSSAKNLAGLDMPEGCFEKLELFFKSQFKSDNVGCFERSPKVRVKYLALYEPEKSYEHSNMVKPADSLLKDAVTFPGNKKRKA